MEASGGKRRVWPAEERQRIVAEATAPNASVALQHGVNTNLLFKWISRSRQGLLLEAAQIEVATKTGGADEHPDHA